MREGKKTKRKGSYAKAINMAKRLKARLSKYAGVNSSTSLNKLISDISREYNLGIAEARDIYEAIFVAESLLNNDELRAKLAKRISSSGSPIESKLAEYLDDAGIEYIREHRIGRYRVDFLLPDKKLVIECQGYVWHQDPKTYIEMEMDLCRRNAISKAGYRILYYTGRQVFKNKAKILKDISLF